MAEFKIEIQNMGDTKSQDSSLGCENGHPVSPEFNELVPPPKPSKPSSGIGSEIPELREPLELNPSPKVSELFPNATLEIPQTTGREPFRESRPEPEEEAHPPNSDCDTVPVS